MKVQHLQFGEVKLKAGWSASDAWKHRGPVVLVDFKSAKGELQRSRLDIQKGMFIDPLPVKVGTRSTHKIWNSVLAADLAFSS